MNELKEIIDMFHYFCGKIPERELEKFHKKTSKIQQAIEKAKLWDSISGSSVTEYEIKLQSQNKSLSEENTRLKEELSITQKAFRECSQSEMSCRESLPLARKKIDELYTEIQNLKSQLEELTNNLAVEMKGHSNIIVKLEQANKVIDEIKSPEFLEKLASIEHEQWIEWATSLMEKEKLSPERIKRWKSLLIDYPNLSSEFKEQDRKYARMVIKSILSQYKEEE